MQKFFRGLILLTLLTLVSLSVLPGMASAHERRDVGKYQFVVGWIVEPAFEGQKTGVDLRVTDSTTQKPVEGLEKTLKVEITHVSTKTSKAFDLRTIFRDPGHYTNDLIITSPGQYRFHFFGTVEGTQVNETFESGPGRFNDMQPSADLQFPERLPSARELSGVTRTAQQTAQDAKDSASKFNTLATAAVVLGGIGTVLSIASLAVVFGRRR